MKRPNLAIALLLWAPSHAAGEILQVEGSHGSFLGFTTIGLPDQSTDTLAYGRPIDPTFEHYRSLDLAGGYPSGQTSLFGMTDYEGLHGSGHSNTTASATGSVFSLTTTGSGSVVSDDDYAEQSIEILGSSGGYFELRITPFTELEITIDTSIGLVSHPNVGEYRSRVQVYGLADMDEIDIKVTGRSHTPMASSVTLTGFTDEAGILNVSVGSSFTMHSSGTEIGGIAATVNDIGASITIRVVPSPSTFAIFGSGVLVATRRRR